MDKEDDWDMEMNKLIWWDLSHGIILAQPCKTINDSCSIETAGNIQVLKPIEYFFTCDIDGWNKLCGGVENHLNSYGGADSEVLCKACLMTIGFKKMIAPYEKRLGKPILVSCTFLPYTLHTFTSFLN